MGLYLMPYNISVVILHTEGKDIPKWCTVSPAMIGIRIGNA